MEKLSSSQVTDLLGKCDYYQSAVVCLIWISFSSNSCSIHYLEYLSKWLDIVSLWDDKCYIILRRFCVNYIFDKFVKLSVRLPHSRRLEEEADAVGLMLAAKVIQGYFENSHFLYDSTLGLLRCTPISWFLAGSIGNEKKHRQFGLHFYASVQY